LSLLSIFATRAAAELQHQDREAVLEEKVERRTEALRAAQASLVEQEKMAALGALVAGVAHEVNTPVGVALTAASAMSSYTQQLVAALNAPKVSRSDLLNLVGRLNDGAALIESNLHRAAALIGNFKQLAVDQGTEHLSTLALHDYVQGVVSAHSPEMRKAGIRVSLEIPDDLRPRLPPGKFSQVLSNLLMNASRHAWPKGGGGQISIRAWREQDKLLLEFADDGAGMAPAVRERIFEPFFTTRRGQGGSGLGLHIVYTILHQLGGQIEVKSSEGGGSTFLLKLPMDVTQFLAE
jgi:signal transduction histidine kinase